MKKYEITDIAHPDNPKLHRIRALTDVGADVHKGDFGGYVETEDMRTIVKKIVVSNEAFVFELPNGLHLKEKRQ